MKSKRIVETIKDDVERNFMKVYEALDKVVEAFEQTPTGNCKQVKVQWQSSCSISGNQRQNFEVDPDLNSGALDFKNGSEAILPERELLCEQ